MNPLDELKDIHLPSQVDWWPLAPGWWALLVSSLIVLLLLFKGLYHLKKRKQRVNTVMSLLDDLAPGADADTLDDKAWLERLSARIRQVAINKHGRQQAAGLIGQDWLNYLDKTGKTKAFTQGVGQVLASFPYQQTVELNRGELLNLTRQWLKEQAKKGGSHA